MKLDSIIYDYGSLGSAIASTLNYESKSFKAIYPSDTATSLVNVLASYGAMIDYKIVSAMANMYTDSAYSEAGIYQLAETLGNRLHGNISSELYCSIERLNLKGMNNIVIPIGSKFTVGSLNFFNPENIVFPVNENKVNDVKLIQGILQKAEFVTSGISGERFYFCDDFKCNTNLVRVYINDKEWHVSDTFLPYVVTDDSVEAEAEVVIVRTDPNGRTYVKVGNNTNGIIPSKDSVLRVEYISNEGANGNLNNNQITINLNTPIYYTGSQGERIRLEVEITATTTASGGFDTQSLDVLRESSPFVFGSGQRAVRRNDYKSMLLNKCGYLTCNVWGEYEEAAINGGYDKIMMNMVYYTGIKSIQKYDAYPISDLRLSLAQFQNETSDFCEIPGTINSARGFSGSYVIDISSYTTDNVPVSVKYRDALGNGILTCDPSVNIIPTIDNFEEQLYPINDFSEDDLNSGKLTIEINQSDEHHDANKLITGGFTKSSGKNDYGQPMVVNFNNPFQIRINYNTETSIAAFAFETPRDSDRLYFPHKLAIYGTNEDPSEDTAFYENVKNNTEKWDKLTGIQTIENSITNGDYSDWITTNVYTPGKSTTVTENVVNKTSEEDPEGQRLDGHSFRLRSFKDEDYTFTVKINGITQMSNSYHVANNILTFVDFISEDANIVVTGTLYDWSAYKHYVIEVYEIQDLSIKNPQFVSIRQIKAIYKKSASLINYTQNNAISLKIPVISIDNVVYATTRPTEEPLTIDWLRGNPYPESDDAITPELDKVYFVKDPYSYRNTLTLTNPGKRFEENEVIDIPYYKLSVAVDPNNLSTDFKVNETFSLQINSNGIQESRDVIVTDVNDATGGISAVAFVNGCEYSGDVRYENATITVVGITRYTGDGENYDDVEFTITSSKETTDGISLTVTEVDPDDGTILDYNVTPMDLITRVGNISGTFTIIPQSSASDRENATITLESVKLYDYNEKTFIYNGLPLDTTDPVYALSNSNIKSLALPYNMEYYEYKVTLNGIREPEYQTNDRLMFNTVTDNFNYVFEVVVNNIASQQFTTTLSIDGSYPTNILRGKSGLNISNAPLIMSDGTNKTGATITIEAVPTVKLTASYTGNYYSNNDIQMFDLPIINKYNHFTTYLEFKQPKIKNVSIEVNLEYENVSDYQVTKANVIKAINAIFDLKPFSMGKTLNVSDIWKAINEVAGVKRFLVLTPTANIDCMPYELINLPADSLIINDVLNSGYKQ